MTCDLVVLALGI